MNPEALSETQRAERREKLATVQARQREEAMRERRGMEAGDGPADSARESERETGETTGGGGPPAGAADTQMQQQEESDASMNESREEENVASEIEPLDEDDVNM